MEGNFNFGVLIYDEVEPIDLATVGVLSIARRFEPRIQYHTIAPKAGVVNMCNGLQVLAPYGIDDFKSGKLPKLHALVVTGGPGWRNQVKEPETLAFLRAIHEAGTEIVGICTGAMVPAAAGLLDGKVATTRRTFLIERDAQGNAKQVEKNPPLTMKEDIRPQVGEVRERLVVDEGDIITGGGAALCIDMMFHLIATRVSPQVAQDLAELIEYDRAWKANREALGEDVLAKGPRSWCPV
ncbi:DJ-1/PfpI family protein [Massilia sp. W12]|uniref:DJ-1/PfpI family protein n=1 Tax=Massilia sp. W12 TaxID=3126507 RepID=UPI0030D35BF5